MRVRAHSYRCPPPVHCIIQVCVCVCMCVLYQARLCLGFVTAINIAEPGPGIDSGARRVAVSRRGPEAFTTATGGFSHWAGVGNWRKEARYKDRYDKKESRKQASKYMLCSILLAHHHHWLVVTVVVHFTVRYMIVDRQWWDSITHGSQRDKRREDQWLTD